MTVDSEGHRVLSLLDRWRHLPDYQLERRADVFFALYLPELIQSKLTLHQRPNLIPEFPLRIGTVYPNTMSGSASFKVDYLAVTSSGGAVLVELKTDEASRSDKQDAYLRAAVRAGLPGLLSGVFAIFRASPAKRKYFCLLKELEKTGLIGIPEELNSIMARSSIRGATAASRELTVSAPDLPLNVLYVQPKGDAVDVISFRDIAVFLETLDDSFSARFRESLLRWVAETPGQPVVGRSGT